MKHASLNTSTATLLTMGHLNNFYYGILLSLALLSIPFYFYNPLVAGILFSLAFAIAFFKRQIYTMLKNVSY